MNIMEPPVDREEFLRQALAIYLVDTLIAATDIKKVDGKPTYLALYDHSRYVRISKTYSLGACVRKLRNKLDGEEIYLVGNRYFDDKSVDDYYYALTATSFSIEKTDTGILLS